MIRHMSGLRYLSLRLSGQIHTPAPAYDILNTTIVLPEEKVQGYMDSVLLKDVMERHKSIRLT